MRHGVLPMAPSGVFDAAHHRKWSWTNRCQRKDASAAGSILSARAPLARQPKVRGPRRSSNSLTRAIAFVPMLCNSDSTPGTDHRDVIDPTQRRAQSCASRWVHGPDPRHRPLAACPRDPRACGRRSAAAAMLDAGSARRHPGRDQASAFQGSARCRRAQSDTSARCDPGRTRASRPDRERRAAARQEADRAHLRSLRGERLCLGL